MKKKKINKVWLKNNLNQIEELVAKTGKIKGIEELIGTSNSTLYYYRQKHPILEETIQKGKLQREINSKLELQSKTIQKPPKELIASINSVEDTSVEALAAYRAKKIAEHEQELQAQARSGFETQNNIYKSTQKSYKRLDNKPLSGYN
tara:strand:+ start:217 stop:660 length:444 start_codon:yes stop_codon:yes gene_type:complete